MYTFWLSCIISIGTLLLTGCSSGDNIETQVSRVCYQNSDLQLGEKASYRFNIDGNTSVVTLEVTDETAEEYTITFTDGENETQNFTWLKTCQTSEILSQIQSNEKFSYLLGVSSYTKYAQDTQEDITYDPNVDIPDNTSGIYSQGITEDLNNFTVEAGTYIWPTKTTLTYEYGTIPDSVYITSAEIYIADKGHSDVHYPFEGHLFHILQYSNDTNTTIELIAWNDL